MLELRQLKKTYERTNMSSFTAVENVNIKIMPGDFISIIGRSGSGKSTILNMIAGLLRPTDGKILINGYDLWSMNDTAMAKIRNSKIGYIPQGPSLLSNLSILDNVRLPFCFLHKKGSGIEPAMALLEEIGLKDLAERYPAELSGGEMRRAAIARALINNPEILIADEPTGDLDDETTKEVMKLFYDINCNGTTILMVTHENEIATLGNRLFIMSSGKLIEKKSK
ncbi:ABC transporter ATP-binding protein [Clostridium swellfunianum]|uniref:ABC transporter ATP-binding protein n=1 Tax=Clostridium swellfunianum TaxID=1367462 RepID=UPI00203085D9|nr:ABC transporter ATP-binding protein [Clostridium swellfunianum]MCM0647592.1 ABC transporter ATP-binding protein [Clostridium swellfunianum]